VIKKERLRSSFDDDDDDDGANKNSKRKIFKLTLRSRRPEGSRAASRLRPQTCGAFRRAPWPATTPGQAAGALRIGRGRERLMMG